MIETSFTALGRLVLILVQPLAVLWLGLIVLTIVLWRSRQRHAAAGAAFLLLFVQVIGGTNLSGWMLWQLERPFAAGRPEESPICDAIVVLGGGVEPSPQEVGGLHLTSAGDRLVMALELVRLGKAPVLCVGGGYAGRGARLRIEADLVKRAIDERQLSAATVISLGACSDTRDEAMRVRRLADERGWKRILLVTSAVHQRRASATFRKAGLSVVPAPCNFLTTMSPEVEPPRFGVPGTLGFVFTSVWLHEQIGWLEYRRRGWIDAAQ